MSHKVETLALHAGWRADPATGAVAVPIYQTTSYQFQSAEHAANLFALKELGNIYTRIMNPTNDVLEKRVAALEGGAAALAVASGQAASAFSIQNVARAGDNVVSSTDLYGGTWNLFANTMKDQGIEVRFVDPVDPALEGEMAVADIDGEVLGHFSAVQHGADRDADLGGTAKARALAPDLHLDASQLTFGRSQQIFTFARAFHRKFAIAADDQPPGAGRRSRNDHLGAFPR